MYNVREHAEITRLKVNAERFRTKLDHDRFSEWFVKARGFRLFSWLRDLKNSSLYRKFVKLRVP